MSGTSVSSDADESTSFNELYGPKASEDQCESVVCDENLKCTPAESNK